MIIQTSVVPVVRAPIVKTLTNMTALLVQRGKQLTIMAVGVVQIAV